MAVDVMFGVVSGIENPDKFIIKFKAEDWVWNGISYPVEDDIACPHSEFMFDQPEIGDPIMIFKLETESNWFTKFFGMEVENGYRYKWAYRDK